MIVFYFNKNNQITYKEFSPKFNEDNISFEISIEDIGEHFVPIRESLALAVYRTTDVTNKVRKFQNEGIIRLTANPLNFG